MKTIHFTRAAIVGIFIFLGIAIFVTGIFTVGTQRKTFVKGVAVKAIFDDVSGLQPGNNVWLSGVKIGIVKNIIFLEGTRVEITMNIDKDARPHIMKDAKAKIGSDGLIGNRIVIIYGGTEAAGNVSGGDYLKSENGISTDDILATLQLNNKNLLEITGNLKMISKKINDGQGTIGKMINDRSIADNLHSTLANFKKVSAISGAAVAKVDDFVSGLSRQGGLANEIVNDTVVFAEFKRTMDQLTQASATLSDFTQNLNRAGKSLNKTDNAAGAILNDPQIASDLKNIIKNLDASSVKLNEDLKALQHNIFFRGYFRKQEKQKKKTAADSNVILAKDSLHQNQ